VETEPTTPETQEEAGVEEAPAAPEASSEPEAALAADVEELAKKAEERDEFLALAQRTQADFENFRKRAAREQGAAEARGVMRVVRELLPALDNLERALAAAESQPDHGEHHLAEGIRLVQAELIAAMGRVGVEGYSPKGEQFDPNVHEAMAQQPVDGAETGTIVEVFQSGYRIGDDVIRPARVVVAA
jgi:molecular chaperone GrpE